MRLIRLAAGVEEEETEQAAAGAILDAETAHEIHQLREMYGQVHS